MTEYMTLANLKRIGTDENYKQGKAAYVVAHPSNEGRDWTERGAVSAGILSSMGLTEHPEVQKKGPKGASKETTYGTAHRVLADAVRVLVKQDNDPEAGVIRLSLSGEGGATVTLRKGDKGYEAAAKLIAASKS